MANLTRKLKDNTASRNLYGAYNDPKLVEKSNFATQYVKKHNSIVNKGVVRKVYSSQASEARRRFDSSLGMSDKEFKELMGIFDKAQEAFSPKILEFSNKAYPVLNNIVGTVEAIKEGRIKDRDITKSIRDFEFIMYKLMNVVAQGAGLEGLSLEGKTMEDLSSEDIKKLLEGKRTAETFLEGSAPAAATGLKNLFKGYQTFIDAYNKGQENKMIWKTSSSMTPISEKNAWSIRGTTQKSLQQIQGGIGEVVMAREIANAMSQIEDSLVDIVGSNKVNGKLGKSDIKTSYKTSAGNVANVQVSAKSKILKQTNNTKISFEGGKADTKGYFTKYGHSNLYEPYTVLSHYRNIYGYNHKMNSDLYSISSLIGAEHVLEALGVGQDVQFLAFANKITPIYKLLEEMSSGGYELHIGSNDDKFLKYSGKYNQTEAYKEYSDFKGGKRTSWSMYQSYIQQKSNSIKKTQFVLGYRK